MADILFLCPFCGASLSATEETAGAEIPCPGCGKVIVIPSESRMPAGPGSPRRGARVQRAATRIDLRHATRAGQPLAEEPPGLPGAVWTHRQRAAAAAAVAAPPAGHSGTGVAGMVLGILAAVVSLLPLISLLATNFAVSGLVCSLVALATARHENRARGMAVAGLILCVVVLIWIPLCIMLVMGGIGAALVSMVSLLQQSGGP